MLHHQMSGHGPCLFDYRSRTENQRLETAIENLILAIRSRSVHCLYAWNRDAEFTVSPDERRVSLIAMLRTQVAGRRHEEGAKMPSGTVKWFNPTKGFGFIEPDDGGKDAFVHISAVQEAGLAELKEGQKVEFELVPGRDGRMAAGELKVTE